MKASVAMIPWNTPALWREANASLAHVLHHNRHTMGESRRLARQLQEQLTALFPLMEELCRTTCPICRDVCCRHACVWIDFRDLLFLHLAGLPVPDGQLLGVRGERCRFGGPDGCRLDRIRRPFICTWYLCPAQTRRLREDPEEMRRMTECLRRIKHLRREMETSFVRAVS
jgi:hypothetical protein